MELPFKEAIHANETPRSLQDPAALKATDDLIAEAARRNAQLLSGRRGWGVIEEYFELLQVGGSHKPFRT